MVELNDLVDIISPFYESKNLENATKIILEKVK
jgi:hypothetical protein